MLKLTIDLDSPDFLGLDGVGRFLKISLQLRNAGFKFVAIDDLWPVEVDLEQPYSMDVDGSQVTFMQSTTQ